MLLRNVTRLSKLRQTFVLRSATRAFMVSSPCFKEENMQYVQLSLEEKEMEAIKNSPHPGLLGFFDDPALWGEHVIESGRPWRMDELRLKSNVDLHKLWYVLLKERNMLMTMEAEHHRLREHMPNPERFEKVEESLENIMLIVQERNMALEELETGRIRDPRTVTDIDPIGREVTRLTEEHLEPRRPHPFFDTEFHDQGTLKHLYKERENQIREQRKREHEAKLDEFNKKLAEEKKEVQKLT